MSVLTYIAEGVVVSSVLHSSLQAVADELAIHDADGHISVLQVMQCILFFVETFGMCLY